MALDPEKESQQLKNRFHDLAQKSFQQNMFTFTGFLGLGEQELFWQEEGKLRYASGRLWGGYPQADRKVLRFGSPEELGYEEPYAIACLHIRPVMEKFADELSHRDFLGALMNLGIERSTLGDIRTGGKDAYLFCLENVAPFLGENLVQVKHTNVKCEIVTDWQDLPFEEPQPLAVQVASCRADAVIAKVYRQSRADVLELFRSGRVYVDGRLCENNSRLLKEGEAVNARGFGKFIYRGVSHETRKGNLSVQVEVFR